MPPSTSSLFQVPSNWLVLPAHHSTRLHRCFLLTPQFHLQHSDQLCTYRHLADYFHHDSHRSPRRRHSSSSSSSSSPPSITSDDGYEDEKHKQAAREAVSEILQENGVSEEESNEIAIKAPKYLEMLMDSVRDLDELFQSTNSSNTSSSLSSYKKRVFEMGKQKGDKGLVPLLESMVGLPLPSAIHIARYLSAHTPPSLLHKVKYLKEILFSNVDGKVPIASSAQRMMLHLSVPVDEDVQQTLSFLEKIQARRGGLHLLGSGDGSFRYLIESFPRLLLLSVESHMKPMVDFLRYIGVPKDCVRSILLLYPPILFYDIEKEIKPRRQVYGDDMEFGKLLLKYPWILSTSILKNYEEILTFFYAEKVAVVSIRRAIKGLPVLLGCSVGKLKLMIQQLRELGVTEKMLHQVIGTSPQLLMQKPRELCQVVMYLKGLGLEDESVGRMVGRCPEIFMTNIDKTLKKKVEFLLELGVSRKHLPRVIRKYPELFVCDVNNSMLPRMMYLLKIGLSKREIAFMVGRFSPLLGYSIEEVLRPKYEFLVKGMQKPLEEVVEYPRYFSYSLEKKIKPRFWALKDRNCECSLKDMLGKNDEEFAADYMSGNPPPS
ncbi:Mitochodrial transcription termination factor-related protein [Cynara cardunculus var. scolymus]|uniref:Mitochodrial transcription termination factor-related protein n=1 Tax=Cynara cardunculus var. scolymus TaxID=59895 RepID=A0A103YB21_CYNCS|nr:Mitochodrial transcription termination factor-related protein [Cynara cardunculus var. scolymus]